MQDILERAKQIRLGLLPGERSGDGLPEVVDVAGDVVRQVPVLRVAPYVLDRVQFRRVGRQPLELDPVAVRGLEPLRRGAVRAQPVEHRGDRPAELRRERTQETVGIGSADVVVEQLEVEAEPTPARGSGS